MRIGEKNYLLIEKRGCNFSPNDSSVKGLDVGNYRVYIRFVTKDGTEAEGDVLRFRGGRELATQMCRYDGAANCTGFPYHWSRVNMDTNGGYPYTIDGILRYVNHRSAEHYDAIKWVETFTFDQEAGKNFVPSSKIAEWAKREHLDFWNTMDGIRVKTYTGVWKFMMYKIRTFQGTKGPYERVTIFLEEGSGDDE